MKDHTLSGDSSLHTTINPALWEPMKTKKRPRQPGRRGKSTEARMAVEAIERLYTGEIGPDGLPGLPADPPRNGPPNPPIGATFQVYPKARELRPGETLHFYFVRGKWFAMIGRWRALYGVAVHVESMAWLDTFALALKNGVALSGLRAMIVRGEIPCIEPRTLGIDGKAKAPVRVRPEGYAEAKALLISARRPSQGVER